MFSTRQDRLQEVLGEKSILILKPENIFYLTGFKGSFGMYLQTKKKRVLITDSRYKSKAQEIAQKDSIDFQLYDKNFKETFAQKQKGDCVIEKSISLEQFEGLEKTFLNFKFIPTSNIVEKLRIIKDSEEIQLIKKAQQQVDSILLPFLKKHTKEGISEQALCYQLKQELENKGEYTMSFDPIVAFGENSANPHYTPGKRKLQKNENILIDCGVKYEGYCSDMTRNAFFGKPSKEYLEKYTLLLEAQKRTLEKCSVDTSVAEIDNICRNFLGEEDKYFSHSLGHGVGLEIHEIPGFSKKSDHILALNEVIAIEPAIYYENEFGIRIEDLILITKDKPEILSKTSKDLLILK